METPVLVSGGTAIGRLVLNRPAQRNALNTAMCEALRAGALALDADPAVRVVVVSGAGPVFCAGADVKERQGMSASDVRSRRVQAFAAYEALERLSKPTIAMVHGAVVGSGGEIAAACDFIVAADDVTFRYPEVQAGTIGATQRLPRLIGLPRAKELLYTGRALPAAEALAWGLVVRVVVRAELDGVVEQLATTIAAAPSASIRLTKRCLDPADDPGRRAALARELLAIDELLVSDRGGMDLRVGTERGPHDADSSRRGDA